MRRIQSHRTRPAHGAEEHGSPADIDVVIPRGLGDTLADRLEPREMDDGLGLKCCKHLIERNSVADVALCKRELAVAQAPDALECLGVPIVEAVDHVDLVPSAQKFEAGVAANVPSAAGDQDPHEFTPRTNSTAVEPIDFRATNTNSINATPMLPRRHTVVKNWREV